MHFKYLSYNIEYLIYYRVFLKKHEFNIKMASLDADCLRKQFLILFLINSQKVIFL
jgi:hypothetical protein